MSEPNTLLRAAALQSVPIEIRVSVGRARPLLRDVMELAPEALLTLDSRVEDPVALYVGDRMIAEGGTGPA